MRGIDSVTLMQAEAEKGSLLDDTAAALTGGNQTTY
jgi:hypothetical protein